MAPSIQKDHRINTAITPSEKLETDCYDWHERHQAVLAIKDCLNPDVVLIGDSITHFWGGEPSDGHVNGAKAWAKTFHGLSVLNLGFGWDRTQNVLWRLNHHELDGLNPKLVVIHIGSNNTSETENARSNTPDEVVAGIRAVCEEVHRLVPEAQIVLMAVMMREKQPDHPRRILINEINQRLQNLQHDKNRVLLDLKPDFLNSDETLRDDITSDFCHPNETGYAIWGSRLTPFLDQVRKAKSLPHANEATAEQSGSRSACHG